MLRKDKTMYKCPFDFFLGIPCPGCGMTRAFFALIRLDFEEAFYYHPLFPVVIVAAIVIVLYFFKVIKVSHKTKNIAISIFCALFFAVYFIRLFDHDPFISWHPQTGLLSQVFHTVTGFLFGH